MKYYYVSGFSGSVLMIEEDGGLLIYDSVIEEADSAQIAVWLDKNEKTWQRVAAPLDDITDHGGMMDYTWAV